MRSSSPVLSTPCGPAKCQRGSFCLPVPGFGSRTSPLFRSACWRTRSMLETDVSHSSATVFRCMPTSSIRRATLAAEASTGLPRAMTRASLSHRTRQKWNPGSTLGPIRGGENNNIYTRSKDGEIKNQDYCKKRAHGVKRRAPAAQRRLTVWPIQRTTRPDSLIRQQNEMV